MEVGNLYLHPHQDRILPLLQWGGAYTRLWARDDETIVMHVWVKGEKSRADWSLYETSPAKNEKIKFIDDGEYKWIYEVDEHWAAKYQTEDVVHQAEEHMLWFSENYYGNMSEGAILSAMQAACDSDAHCSDVAITDHETVDGQLWTKYTYSSYDDTAIATMKYTNIDLNSSISDDIFDMSKVAPGAIIVDMTAS